ncbi:MAG TPA: flagellar hook-basal body complex protein, partial [Candidatus Binatia bacterium]|nr:flagellar hook-basal body complex protein [Candidatus Binatia bacterium]
LSAEVRGLQVFDASGGERLLDVTFTRSVARAGAWQVRVADATGSEVASGEIRFGGSGAPEPGFSTLALRLPGASADVLLDFGTPGSLEGATSFSSGPTSTVQARQEDGYPAGVLAAARIDDRGQVVLQYANGQERRGMQLAIATVADERQLESQDGVLFRAARGVTPVFGRAGESGRGTVVAGSLELANVDLSREFAEIVILQRGFQASSQILNVCSQAVEDLYSRLPGRS